MSAVNDIQTLTRSSKLSSFHICVLQHLVSLQTEWINNNTIGCPECELCYLIKERTCEMKALSCARKNALEKTAHMNGKEIEISIMQIRFGNIRAQKINNILPYILFSCIFRCRDRNALWKFTTVIRHLLVTLFFRIDCENIFCRRHRCAREDDLSVEAIIESLPRMKPEQKKVERSTFNF